MYLINLPYELLTYLLKDFIDLNDLLCLSQVSHYLRIESKRVIKEQWEIDFSPSQYSLLKVQYHYAVVSLNQVSRRLIHRIKKCNPSAFPPLIMFDKIEQNAFQEIGPFSPTVGSGVDNIENENSVLADRLQHHSRKLYHLLKLESRLNENILNMIKNQITHTTGSEHHIKLLIDTVIHHAIIIQGRSMQLYCGSLEIHNNCRAFAAVVTRLILQCSKKFPNKSITAYLMNGIIRFFEYASYKLLSLMPRLSTQFLSQFKRSCSTESNHHPYQFKPGTRNLWSFIKAENKHQDSFILILYNMTACCDLIGASYSVLLLRETNTRCVLLKLASILSIFRLEDVKKLILTDLKEVWFISHFHLLSQNFIDWLQSTIEN